VINDIIKSFEELRALQNKYLEKDGGDSDNSDKEFLRVSH